MSNTFNVSKFILKFILTLLLKVYHWGPAIYMYMYTRYIFNLTGSTSTFYLYINKWDRCRLMTFNLFVEIASTAKLIPLNWWTVGLWYITATTSPSTNILCMSDESDGDALDNIWISACVRLIMIQQQYIICVHATISIMPIRKEKKKQSNYLTRTHSLDLSSFKRLQQVRLCGHLTVSY